MKIRLSHKAFTASSDNILKTCVGMSDRNTKGKCKNRPACRHVRSLSYSLYIGFLHISSIRLVWRLVFWRYWFKSLLGSRMHLPRSSSFSRLMPKQCFQISIHCQFTIILSFHFTLY